MGVMAVHLRASRLYPNCLGTQPLPGARTAKHYFGRRQRGGGGSGQAKAGSFLANTVVPERGDNLFQSLSATLGTEAGGEKLLLNLPFMAGKKPDPT